LITDFVFHSLEPKSRANVAIQLAYRHRKIKVRCAKKRMMLYCWQMKVKTN